MFHFAGGPTESTLPHPPNVTISKVQFSPDESSRLLGVSSWDGAVRVYNLGPNAVSAVERRSFHHMKPVLSFAFCDKSTLVTGGVDSVVKLCDVETGGDYQLGKHDEAVRVIAHCKEHSMVVSGSWDSTMRLWDVRARTSAGYANNGERVYAMDSVGNRVVIGTKDRKIVVWDLRNLNSPEQLRESPLKFQTRAIACFPTGESFVLSSIEGRVAVEYFDQGPEVQKKKYAFKCHRGKNEDSDLELIYPVNCIAFHPFHNTFATGGSDAMVNIWDPVNRKRICQLHKFPTSVVSVAFDPTGSQLAIASSYMQEFKVAPVPEPENTVTIRKTGGAELKPK